MRLGRLATSLGPWLVAGAIGWTGVVWLGASLLAADPPRAGFDLSLLLDGARRVAAGATPYDPAMLAGGAPSATDLFYSYPPPVAQAMTLVAWMSDPVVLVLWGVAATAGLGVVVWAMAGDAGRDPRRTAVRAIAAAPLFLPFAVALLFGNLDAWYPLLYGLLVLSVLPGAGRGRLVAAGVALAVMAVAKLHPASLLVWVAVRAYASRGGSQGVVLATAAVTGIAIVGASLIVGGVQPWLDYATVVRVGAGAELVDPRNIGPVSLLGALTGLDAATLRAVQAVVAVGAVMLTGFAAARVREPLTSVAIAATLSLVILPVTWYHYLVALVPVAAALAIRHPSSRPRLVGAMVLADVAIGWLPLSWLGVALLLVAAARVDPAEEGWRRAFA